MSSKYSGITRLEFQPLTPQRWSDLETLFGKKGACGGCWCMWWRLTRAEFKQQRGERNKAALKKIVAYGEIPGLLVYSEGRPIGWCAVAQREVYPTLERSRVLKRVDDKPVWSIVCFFVAKAFRRKGLSARLLKAAVDYVKKQGGKIVEGYPIEPEKGWTPDPFVYTGLASAFRKVGFVEVLRRSQTRPIMRYLIRESQDGGW
jgi:GNAT superfamily N-acetyltransferase